MHKRIQTLLILVCIATFALTAMFYYRQLDKEVQNVTIKTDDKNIAIQWNQTNIFKTDYVEIIIYKDNERVLTAKVPPIFHAYYFDEGEHGSLYNVCVTLHQRDGEIKQIASKPVLFWDYARLAAIPMITIDTINGENPTYEIAEKKDKTLWGASETNNEYVQGKIKINGQQVLDIVDSVKIRTRGNTSTVGPKKKSYKIKLHNSCKLINASNINSDEWILLNNASSLETYIGTYIASIVGVEWQMPVVFVNLILNGDYKGCYYLVPAVNRSSAGNLVGKDGYIFENDAYWWLPGKSYIKTKKQIHQLAYTFKYPDNIQSDDAKALYLKDILQSVEDDLAKDGKRYQQYIDEKSFAKWILVRDIMGNIDGGGCNMYYYMKNATAPIKMGPLWDFDSSFSTYNSWSNSRYGASFIMNLFRQESFNICYEDFWQSISKDLISKVIKELESLENSYGSVLDESWQLEAKIYEYESCPSFAKQKERAMTWFPKRVNFIDNQFKLSDCVAAEDFTLSAVKIKSYVDKTVKKGKCSDVVGWAFVVDRVRDAENLKIGLLIDGEVYLGKKMARPDVKKHFALDGSDQLGFAATIPKNKKYKVVIVDMDNKIIYGAL